MKKSNGFLRVSFLIAMFSFCFSIIANAVSLNGPTGTSPLLGSRTFSAYNTITVDSHGAKATTTISSSSPCSSDQMGVYLMLQDSSFHVVLSRGYVYNTNNNVSSLSASTGYYNYNGTYYSGGQPRGWNDSTNPPHHTDFSIQLSPGLSVSGSKDKGLIPAYDTNKNGQSFGIIYPNTAKKDYPDLVGAVGIDGTKGYVYSAELFGGVNPSSPKAASALMMDRDYIQGKIVNLYASDGVTIIGKFLAGGLIGVTVQEDQKTITYNEDGTIVMTYKTGEVTILKWK